MRGFENGMLIGLLGLVILYGVAWFGMHVLDQPDIFWLIRGIE